MHSAKGIVTQKIILGEGVNINERNRVQQFLLAK